jgi:hypothetical protein
VEQLQQVYVLLRVERDGGNDVFGAEGRVTAVDNVFQVCGGYLRRGDVEGEDFEGEILEGKVLPLGRPVVGERRDFLWDEKAAVRGETLEDDFLKGELFGVSINWWMRHDACVHRKILLVYSGTAVMLCGKT